MARTCPGCGYSPIGPYTDNCPLCAEPVRGGGCRSGGGGGYRGGGGGGGFGGMSLTTRWVLGGLFVTLLGFGGCCGLGGWRAKQNMADFRQQMAKAKADMEEQRKARTVTMSAEQLLQEFQTDPEAADKKYHGKYLVVSGVVERVGTNQLGSTFVILHAGDEDAKIKIECFYYPEYDEDGEGVEVAEGFARIKNLSKGQKVTVGGEYGGRVSNVQLQGCALK